MASKYLKKIKIKESDVNFYSIKLIEKNFPYCSAFPYSYKILTENILRNNSSCKNIEEKIILLQESLKGKNPFGEIEFYPSRVLMQDFTGVPALADLASMREKAKENSKIDSSKINPLKPVDLVVDHSVMVDKYASPDALSLNTALEFERNQERYKFLKWGQKNLENFRVIPPGVGICHQVNMEFLAKVVWYDKKNNTIYPDSLVGTDSHTTMINGLSVLGWGVGGIEAEAVMLGESIAMSPPKVLGVNLKGQLKHNTTPTDLVLTITNILRKHGVVNKFVEFYGKGLKNLSLADRATIANMAPEYGATCGFFPIDKETIKYLKNTGRDQNHCLLVKKYAVEQGLWYDYERPLAEKKLYNEEIEIDISNINPVLAGPKRPQDKVLLSEVHKKSIETIIASNIISNKAKSKTLNNGDVVLAAITSCTNTANPYLMITAGLLAKNAVEKGLSKKSWVKTSLAPGSLVVKDYLEKLGLLTYLERLGFNIVGYGCTTCIGNSGPLDESVELEIIEKNLNVSSVLSGNRNFEGRVHPLIKSNWLASPPLVVAYSILGSTTVDITKKPLGFNKNNKKIYLKDLWPKPELVNNLLDKIESKLYQNRYKKVELGNAKWNEILANKSSTYNWNITSTYVQNPPFLSDKSLTKNNLQNIKEARILAILGDSITTDHISPAGSIKEESPAGKYLTGKQVSKNRFNSYGARRGSHDIMVRGTFANVRLRNKITPDKEGGYTKLFPDEKIMTIYDAAEQYKKRNTPLVIFAGKEYGTGSSRDWAAKGTKLLGVRAVIVESFERIHRSNLIGMGILPIQLKNGLSIERLNLKGSELVNINIDLEKVKKENVMDLEISIIDSDKKNHSKLIPGILKIETAKEFNYIKKGNILNYVLEELSN
ncbi:aconitate hydratase AcnA [Alphaproteobacteria bacterium]|nr:aconitate hydratase AcnA [Alphaproteobacteria bacterium]